MKDIDRIIIHGTIASLALLAIYFAIVSLAQGFDHAVEEFISLSYLMVPLVAGFGIQVSLYSYTRHRASAMRQGSASVTASGGLSTVSMIACCAHHLTDFVPFIGITATAVFLTAYQTFFIAVGLFSNVIGIAVILAVIQKHQLYDPNGAFMRIMRLDMGKVRNLAVGVSLIAIISFGWVSASSAGTSDTTPTNLISLAGKADQANGLTVEVDPVPFSLNSSVSFGVKLDTHSGDLSFDITKVAYLADSNGVTYLPQGWDGSLSGGHHRQGTLAFPPLSGSPTAITLTFKDLYGSDRTFEWSLTG